MNIRKAERKQAKIRLGISGPSGSGKSFSALKIAHGLCNDWTKIAVIDTERGSADLYSNLGEYNVMTLEAPFTPERYIQAVRECEKAGMQVIIIDSITHEWEGTGGCLDIHEQLGGTFKAWADVTPRHRAFIDAILLSRCHMITAVRTKIDYAITTENGKTKIDKVGMKEVTREGFEYELTINLTLDMNHNARVVSGKDRTGLFDSKPSFVPDESIGKRISDWCNSGIAKAEPTAAQVNAQQVAAPDENENPEMRAALITKFSALFTAIASPDPRVTLFAENIESKTNKQIESAIAKLSGVKK